MALAPEFQTLIETIHQEPRDSAWAADVSEQYQAALSSIEKGGLNIDDASFDALRNDAVHEILRQHADERIVNDLLNVAQDPNSDEFADRLEERASSWPSDLQIYEEEELRGVPDDQPEVHAGALRQLQNAGREGNAVEIMAVLLSLQNSDNAVPVYSPANGEADVRGSLTPVGQEMFDYIKDLIYDTNQNNASEVFNQIARGAEEVTISADADILNAAFRTRIMEDIQNGTFPIDGLGPEEALRMANLVHEIAFSNPIERRGQGSEGPVNIRLEIPDARIAQAVDAMFEGQNPALSSDMRAGLSAHQFTQEYLEVLNMRGAAISGDDLVEHFTKLLGDVDSDNPREMVPPEIDIPPHMREQFYAEIHNAFEASLNGSTVNPDAFGNHMHEQFGILDEQYQAPMLHDDFDYGDPIELQLGEETENGYMVVSPDGQEMFELTLGENGFAIYALNTGGESIEYDGMADINEKADIVEFFGEHGFTVRAVSHKDEDMDHSNSQISSYYIQTEDGAKFHIGFDAVPESSVRDEFREQRNASLDQGSELAENNVDQSLTAGQAARPTQAEFGL